MPNLDQGIVIDQNVLEDMAKERWIVMENICLNLICWMICFWQTLNSNTRCVIEQPGQDQKGEMNSKIRMGR